MCVEMVVRRHYERLETGKAKRENVLTADRVLAVQQWEWRRFSSENRVVVGTITKTEKLKRKAVNRAVGIGMELCEVVKRVASGGRWASCLGEGLGKAILWW